MYIYREKHTKKHKPAVTVLAAGSEAWVLGWRLRAFTKSAGGGRVGDTEDEADERADVVAGWGELVSCCVVVVLSAGVASTVSGSV